MQSTVSANQKDFVLSLTDKKERHKKVILYWLAGIGNPKIAKRTGVHLNTVATIVKKIEKQIAEYGQADLRQLLKSSFIKSLKIYDDTSSELIEQFTDTQLRRDNAIQANSDTDQGIEAEVRQYNDRLRKLVTELAKNDSSFVDTMQKMGVPQVDDNDKKKGPIDTASSYYSAIEADSEVADQSR